jgi:predicted RNA-binding protein
MCDTNLYLWREGKEELFMESIDLIRPEGETVVVRDIFGEQRTLRARFRETHLSKHRIVFEELREG